MRKLAAKSARIQQALEDIAGATPTARGKSRALCDRCAGALLVTMQLRRDDGWMGAARPDVATDGGLTMARQLLRTRHSRLVEAAEDDEARLASRELLEEERAALEGQICALAALMDAVQPPPDTNAEDGGRGGGGGGGGGSLSEREQRRQRASIGVAVATRWLASVEAELAAVAPQLDKLQDELAELIQVRPRPTAPLRAPAWVYPLHTLPPCGRAVRGGTPAAAAPPRRRHTPRATPRPSDMMSLRAPHLPPACAGRLGL